MDLGRDYHRGKKAEGATQTQLREATLYHLHDHLRKGSDNRRVLNELGSRDDRSNLLSSLGNLHIEPLNDQAGKMLRLAVITRKTSQDSKHTGRA